MSAERAGGKDARARSGGTGFPGHASVPGLCVGFRSRSLLVVRWDLWTPFQIIVFKYMK